MTPSQLVQRRQELHNLIHEIDAEILAIEGALAVHDTRRRGRPRKRDLYTRAEARDAYNRYRAGEKTPYTTEGYRQYNRVEKRRARQREA